QDVALECLHRVRELEVIEVTEHDHVRIGVYHQDLRDEVVLDLRLLVPLALGRSRRWLEVAHQRLIAAFRDEVVGYDEEAGGGVPELDNERLAAAVTRRHRWRDAARSEA